MNQTPFVDAEFITAESSKGSSKSRTPVDAPNSFVTKTTARVQFLVSDGETGGLYDQTNPLKSVFLDNVAVQNADGSFNTANVQLEERYGLPSQTVMNGFPAVRASYNVVTKVTVASPVTYTTTTSDIDSIRVTIRFPALFQTASNGDTKPSTVVFNIYTKLTSGSFTLYKTVTKTDKCIAPADADYFINRPAGSGTWQVKIERVTADNSSINKANDIYFQIATEIKNAALPYNNRALIGLTITAETAGADYPVVAFKYRGVKVQVPSNYNPVSRSYTGVWDGLFSGTTAVTSNPIWNLLDLLTNTRHGLGIDIADIDIYSFYDAAYYADELVPALVDGAISGTEPRYSFNHQYIDERLDEWTAAQNLASVAGAVIYTAGNLVKLVQDRPTAVSRILTNSTVVDGDFSYSSSTLPSRVTACTVYWSDPLQNGVAVPAYYEDAVGVARYGLNTVEINGFGITSEGQALRHAKWNVETSLSNPTTVSFKVGLKNAGITPGEIVEVYDSHYAGAVKEARVLSSTSSTVTLDRSLSVTSGNTFVVLGSDGSTLETRTISVTTTGATLTFTGGAITALAGAGLAVTGAISPRKFKVTNVSENRTSETLEWNVTGLIYDNNKFGRVDSTPTGIVPVYQANNLIPSAPTNLTFRESSSNNSGIVSRALLISWTRPTTGVVTSYLYRQRVGGSNWEEYDIKGQSFEIAPATSTSYEVEVRARNSQGTVGAKVSGTYSIDGVGTSSSLLNAPTTLTIQGGGTTFTGSNAVFVFTNPSSNADITDTLRDFEVSVLTTGAVLLRTFYLPAVPAGSNQIGSYTFDNNIDDGGPRRSFVVSVKCRDTNNNLSSAVSATFSNPAPAAVTVTTAQSFRSNLLTITRPTDADFAGFLLWGSTTSGFTPSSGNLVYEGNGTAFTHSGLGESQTWYYKAAAYDDFGKDYAGTGLNVSSQVSVTTLAGNNTNEYRVTGVTWTPNSPSSNKVAWTACTVIKSLGASAGSTWSISASNATWTSGILYIYYTEGNTSFQSTTTLSNAIADNKIIVATYRGGTNLEIGDGKAYIDGSFVIAGTVGAAQLVTGSAVITQAAQIATAIITNANIADATIETLKLKNGAVTDIKNVSASGNTPTIVLGGTGAGVTLNYSWEYITPEWTSPNIPSIGGPFPTNVFGFTQSPRLSWFSTAITTTCQMVLQRWNGSAFVDIVSTNTTLALDQLTTNIGSTMSSANTYEAFQLFTQIVANTRHRVVFRYTMKSYTFATSVGSSTNIIYGNYSAVVISQLR